MNNSGGSTLTTIAKSSQKQITLKKKKNKQKSGMHGNPVGIWQLTVGGDKNIYRHTDTRKYKHECFNQLFQF